MILPPQDCHVAIIKQYMVSIIYILYSYLLNKVGESILHTIKAQDKYQKILFSSWERQQIFLGITDLTRHKKEWYQNLNANE